jgi:nucleotide-binding universal stress UspA family protein
MLNHIMVPLDGSALSEDALYYAHQIVAPHGKLTLMTVVEIPLVMADAMYPVYHMALEQVQRTDHSELSGEKLFENANHYLHRVAERIRESDHSGLDVRIYSEIGEPAEIIIKTARAQHVDAIVMSTHGRSGFSRWLFGSVTTKVLNAAPCPVFVIPSREIQEKLKTSTSEMYIG